MSRGLERSMRAWQEALTGMRTSKPTYKTSLLVAVLELLDADGADGAPLTSFPADGRLAAAFDLVLAEHGALEGPGRFFQPVRHLCVRRGSMPDQLWHREGELLRVREPFGAVLGSAAGREWLRGRIAAELVRRGSDAGARLAARLQGGWADEADRLQQAATLLARESEASFDALPPLVRETLSALEAYGMAERVGADAWRRSAGDWQTGRRVWEALRDGNTSMSFLRTTAQRRQGQQIFRARVLGNFDTWCAVCPVGMPELLEAAHLLPVESHPEVGLDLRNGLSLCRNHHRALDEGHLALDQLRVRVSPALRSPSAEGIAAPLLGRARKPHLSILPEALAWRLTRLRA